MGRPAARLGDTTMHGSPLTGAACTNVLIGGKPAWRIGDQHTCTIPNAPPPGCDGAPHGPGITVPSGSAGEGVTLIGGKPGATLGDIVMEPHAIVPLPPNNNIVQGEMTVLVGAMGGGAGGAGAGNSPRSGKCTRQGHPVNVATGDVTAYGTDLQLPGLIPIRLVRTYSSRHSNIGGEFGFGWSHSLGWQLTVSGNQAVYTDPEGRNLRFELAPGATTAEIVPEGVTLRIEGPEWRVTTPTGREIVFRPVSEGVPAPPLLLRDAFGNALEFLYRDGFLAAIRDSSERYILFRRDSTGRITALELADQEPARAERIREFRYDGAGDLVAVVDGVGSQWRYEYHGHLLLKEIDRNGDQWHFRYDAQRRCVETWGPEGLLYRRFHFSVNRTLMIDSLGWPWVYEWNDRGLVTALTTPLGYREETLWNEQDQALSRTDRNGHTEFREYDPDTGNPAAIVDASGAAWKFEYNQRGQEIRRTDPEGNVSESFYDDRGAKIGYRDALGRITRFEVDTRGMVSAVISPDGRRTSFTRDRYGFPEEIRDSGGTLLERLRFDFRGRLLEQTRAGGGRIRQTWNNNDR
ncbi:MAG TPA: DUF6531 domain-containing protein, partial [Bryobacteraceae bacterium]|nr:DUF6531 domain-containing protein [Bryobacteraceae bacterium]